jgi:hypothetical protein
MQTQGNAITATFMIVAHNHPSHLARLASALDAPWATVLINVDAKIDAEPFHRACEGLKNVHFVEDARRTSVHWGGMGLTMSARRMMDIAIERFSPDRLCMLSGVDYVLKPMPEVQDILAQDLEFLRIDRKLNYGGRSIHDDFISMRHWNDVQFLNPRSSPSRRLRRLAMPLASRIGRERPPVPNVYHGSGWWCISRQAAQWVMQYFADHPDFETWLRRVNCPDEIFMQTLMKLSPRRDRISQDYTVARLPDQEANLHGVHFIEWGYSSSSPKTLNIDHLADMDRCPAALFGRKIDPPQSEPLLSRLDERVSRNRMRLRA